MCLLAAVNEPNDFARLYWAVAFLHFVRAPPAMKSGGADEFAQGFCRVEKVMTEFFLICRAGADGCFLSVSRILLMSPEVPGWQLSTNMPPSSAVIGLLSWLK